MKLLKTTLLSLGALSLGILVSCTKNKTTKKDPTTKVTTKGNSSSKNTTKSNSSSKKTTTEHKTTQNIDPEVAMNNFLSKVDNLNYKVTSDDLTTYVCEEKLIILDYTSDEIADIAWMSLNGEMFEGKMRDTFDVEFYNYSTAIETATYGFRTINSIKYVSGGNIWDLFTNIGRTGEYVTNSEYIKLILCYLTDAPKDFAGTIEEVKLTINGENANSATLSGHYGMWDKDLEATITFDTQGVNRTTADAWMVDPVYPSAKTEWDFNDLGSFTALFYVDDEDCLPFVNGLTYAYYVNYEAVGQYDMYEAFDKHLSLEDYTNYVNKLASNGYMEEVERDGDKYYHKLLRDDVGLVASVYVEWDETDGFYLALKPYYICDEYHHIDDINDILDGCGLIPLSTKDVIDAYGINVTGADMDSTIYISDYALVLEVELEFESDTFAQTYLEKYIELLLDNGYFEKEASMFEPNEYYQTIDEAKSVRYMINNNILQFRFKASTHYDMDYIDADLQLYGFTTIQGKTTDEWLFYTAKNNLKHEHFQNGHDYIYAFNVSICFADATKADAFADAYASALDALGFDLENRVFAKDLLTVKIEVNMNDDETYMVSLRFRKDSAA